VDPETLPDCVVCYTDSTISLPLIAAYALSKTAPRKRKRLYDQRDAMLDAIKEQYFKSGQVEKIEHRTDLTKGKPKSAAKSKAAAKPKATPKLKKHPRK